MGEFIPQLIDEGKQPRVMLEYSGTLLHGLRQMGLNDVFDSLKRITCDPRYRQAVEWLGCPWGHAVAPSTPPQDFRLHVRAWQHHFAAIFGLEALGRVRGFSPAEMALPNHPGHGLRIRQDAQGLRLPMGAGAGTYRRAARKRPRAGAQTPAAPARLPQLARRGGEHHRASSRPRAATPNWWPRCSPITRPRGFHAGNSPASRCRRWSTQIADGENGGVMMNEFPSKYLEVMRECSGSDTPALNVTEYLEHLAASGIPGEGPSHAAAHFPEADLGPVPAGRRAGATGRRHRATQEGRPPLPHGRRQLDEQHLLGARLRQLLGPMERASALFYEKVLQPGIPTERAPLPQRPVSPALLANQLLPLLGPRPLDRLRPGNLPPARSDSGA